LPIEERKAKLEELLKKPPGVIRYSASFTKDIPELLDRAGKLGLEGLIGKRAGFPVARFRFSRDRHLVSATSDSTVKRLSDTP
jgi:bifunctional non-homologous end joining protein LigD